MSETSNTPSIARNASIVALGNIASRVLGLVRDTVKSHYFGASGAVSVYELAIIVPTTVYDLLIGGMVSSGLVPIFSEYLAKDKREDLWRLVGTLLALFAVLVAAFTVVVQLAAPAITTLMASDYSPELQALFTDLLRILVFSLFFLSLSAILTALLYALQRFTLPAFTTALFNLGIVIGAWIWHEQLGVTSLAIGLLIGAALQVIVQLPGLRHAPLHWLKPDFRHPGLRELLRLYLPIILGIVVNNVSILLSFRFMSATGERSVAWNDYATSLMQFPLGLVVSAVSVAILPRLAQQAATALDDYKATLAQGLRLVITLIVPAVGGMILLAAPIIRLIYEHNAFQPYDTSIVSLVLQIQMLGVFFAAIDQPLIIAFYARKDTLSPALVGVGGMVVYIGIVLGLSLIRPLTLLDLVAATVGQWAAHMWVMLRLFRKNVGEWHGSNLTRTLLKATAATLAMGIVVFGITQVLSATLALDSFLGQVLIVGIPALVGMAVYFGIAVLIRLDEVNQVVALLRRRFGV